MEGWMKDRRMKRKTERRDEGTDERLQGPKGHLAESDLLAISANEPN